MSRGKKLILIAISAIVICLIGVFSFSALISGASEETPIERTSTGLVFDVKPLAEGKYYLNGGTDNCYFEVTDNSTIQYIGDKTQTEELYSLALNPQGYTADSIIEEWTEPKQYYIYRFEKFPDKIMLAWNVNFNEAGEIVGGSGSFIDENNMNIIHYCGCDFIYSDE